MAAAPTIILIGLRGSGKTTLGREFALESARDFIDLDDVTPRFAGCRTVTEAWHRHGEEGFRTAEARALVDALRNQGIVLALGGGTPTAPGARDMLVERQRTARAVIVYLRAGADTLRRRLSNADNAHRPSLTGAGILEEIDAVFERRDPLYLALADEVVEVDGLSTAEALVGLRTAIGQ